MDKDITKKGSSSERGFGAPRIEKKSAIAESELESNVERVRAAVAERQAVMVNQSANVKNSLEKRVTKLPGEIKNEATTALAVVQAEIDKNNAELLAEQEAVANDLAAILNLSPEDIHSTEQESSAQEKTEVEKRQEVSTFVDGLKVALADPDLSPEDRADIEEQIAGFEESLAVAEETGQTIYEPVAVEESVTKDLPRKKEISEQVLELKEKIDELTKEIDAQASRRAVYYGTDGYQFVWMGVQKLTDAGDKLLQNQIQYQGADSSIVKKIYPDSETLNSLAYKIIEKDKKTKDVFQGNTTDSSAYFLSIRRQISEPGARSNTVGVDAFIPKELAAKITDLFDKNPKAANALMLKLLPENLPIGQMEELLNEPKYIAGESSIKNEAESASAPAPAATSEPVVATSRPARMPHVPAAAPTMAPDRAIPPPDAQHPRTPDVVSATPISSEVSKSREALLVERRMLQREWEKEATKLAERKMPPAEQKKYQQLLAETDEKKQKMNPVERKKLIEDLGFTDADYAAMKRGEKDWTLNAIWKRLGEIDSEILEVRPRERAPAVRSPEQESQRGNPNRAAAGSFETHTPTTLPAEDAVKVQELADAAVILNDCLSKLDKSYADNNASTLEQIAADPSLANDFIEQSTRVLEDWQTVANIRDIIPALVPAYGRAEDLEKLSVNDLEAIRQHTVDKLIESIRLVEHVPGTKKVEKKSARKKEDADAMMSEIIHAIQFDDAWYRDHEEETLEQWTKVYRDIDIKKLLQEKLWPVADDSKLLTFDDLKKIREEVIAYLTPIVKAVQESKPTEVPSVAYAAKMAEDNKKELAKSIKNQMAKVVELRKAIRRGEKGSQAKLRQASTQLENLRAKRRSQRK